MVLAIRAPYGSIVEVPCEAQIKEFHAFNNKKKESI